MSSRSELLATRFELGESPSRGLGAGVGALTALGFTVVHDLTISDIWFNVGPMVLAGALCGLCLTWSYNTAIPDHTWRKWLAYNVSYAALLVALGGLSFVVFDPRFTMAEMMTADDALARLLPPVLPLMGAASLVGAVALWMVFGRRVRGFIAILVTQTLLVFVVGHNLAVLGLVEMSSQLLLVVWEFVGLTFFLAGLFSGGVLLGTWARSRTKA